MILSSAALARPSLTMSEGALTTIAFALACVWPGIGSRFFATLEHSFSRLARRQTLSVAVVGATALLLRLALLPLCPVPRPFVPNDFSFLLAADTFASGRLSNPTPAMWMHFESIHISMQPTYMSMYFPAQGLLLAAGKVLTGNAWYGVLLASALMCAAICWMLQAWLPPTWALLGGMLAVLRLGLFSYWVNTYSGGGVISALGGALVLGAFPRFIKTVQLRWSALLALGLVLMAMTRPYEGLLLSLPVAFVLGRWMIKGRNKPAPAVLFRRIAFPLLLLIAAGTWMGYYNYRAFGKASTLPYTINRATYAMAPYFVWQSQRPEPAYRHASMRRFYEQSELSQFKQIHSYSGFLPSTLIKGVGALLFFAGIGLLPVLIMLRRALLDRRMRFMVSCLLVMTAGMLVQIYLIPHYLAPFTAVFYALGLQAMRHLRLWNPGLLAGAGKVPVGTGVVRLMVTVCVLMGVLRAFAAPLHLPMPEWPASQWSTAWYGPGEFGTGRAQVAARLEQFPGKQLVIVRYSVNHNPNDEWVYNAADIDRSKVIWAREMGAADDLELIHYYPDRTVWLVQPDAPGAELMPYQLPRQECASLRSSVEQAR